jgi:NADH-quinone oxidoreductase subunit M
MAMILVWLILIPVMAGFISWIAGGWNKALPRCISLLALVLDFLLVLSIGMTNKGMITSRSDWLLDINAAWIPQFGIGFHLALDGLSLVMLLMTLFLGIFSVLFAWNYFPQRTGFFYFNLLMTMAGLAGIFLAIDLFLFYCFWEVMLIPLYFLISMWGSEKRINAAIKFFLFTQGSGLVMLLSILGLYFIHGMNTGNYTFDYPLLTGTLFEPSVGFWLMLGMLFTFIVKLPVVPFHTWLPDATAEAPTLGGIVLAGFLWNTGAYGILRLVIPLFPEASLQFAPYAMTLGVICILYAAKVALAQFDLKRLIAYSSISHMGFVLLGVYAFSQLAMQGVIVQVITHGISTTALLMLAGSIQERVRSSDMNRMGGFWTVAPRMGGFGLLFIMATLGLPGLGNFIGEFLVLLGTFQSSIVFSVLGSIGLIVTCFYGLRVLQQIFYGETRNTVSFADFSFRETLIMILLSLSIVWIGLYPQPVFNHVDASIQKIFMITRDYFTSDIPISGKEAESE